MTDEITNKVLLEHMQGMKQDLQQQMKGMEQRLQIHFQKDLKYLEQYDQHEVLQVFRDLER